MTIKVLMKPHPDKLRGGHESGIMRVIENYAAYLPHFDVELVPPNSTTYDVKASHAGEGGTDAEVLHCHGLYWSDDNRQLSGAEIRANMHIVSAVRQAKEITVPSNWVAETFRRDMKINPHIIPHGIDCWDWKNRGNEGYILWNKNRGNIDVCDPTPFAHLASLFPTHQFVSTFAPDGIELQNLMTTGLLAHTKMKEVVERSAVYTSLVKETFGIGALEAMAAGKPVLGWRRGGNVELVEHGVNGYLAAYEDYEDLARGLQYCLDNYAILGTNGQELVKKYTWEVAVEQVSEVYKLANENEKASVAIVIPIYNYAHTLERAVNSAINQTHPASEIIIVDDGSTDNSQAVGKKLEAGNPTVRYIYKDNGGVATARNFGIQQAHSKYVVCLDPDDSIEPQFLEACVPELENNRALGIAYTGLLAIMPDGKEKKSPWPSEFDFDKHIGYFNQIPTCCVFRKSAWERLGGYKQRFAPDGAGSEDAEFFTRMCAMGYDAKLATSAPLFRYSLYSGAVSGNDDYQEIDWLHDKAWANDGKHPFASIATPANKRAHDVRQYDEPTISVIIPVGPGHEKLVERALDSLESQSFRKWEAIVVVDGTAVDSHFHDAYPYVRLSGDATISKGAGYARNRGAEIARSPFLIFLDADDWLAPDALDHMLKAALQTESIIFSNYYGKAYLSEEEAVKLDRAGRLSEFEKDKLSTISHGETDYNCESFKSAIGRGKPYHWCLVTSLIPLSWHKSIGGFDEEMPSWEDVDYFWRLAWAGRCFSRVDEPLVIYRFNTGKRRNLANAETEDSLQIGNELLEYMLRKLERMEVMPCSSCPGGANNPIVNVIENSGAANQTVAIMDGEMKRVEYMLDSQGRRNTGQHPVIGVTAFQNQIPNIPMKRKNRAFYMSYGQRKCGDIFLVHHKDLEGMPNRFREVVEQQVSISSIPQTPHAVSAPAKLIPSPTAERLRVESTHMERLERMKPNGPHPATQATSTVPIELAEVPKEMAHNQHTEFVPTSPTKPELPSVLSNSGTNTGFDLQIIPGINTKIAQQMQSDGIDSLESLANLQETDLIRYNGIAETRARLLHSTIQQLWRAKQQEAKTAE